MAAKKTPLRTLFFSTLSLSAFTFGGGYVIVPLMKKRFCDQLHWIDEEEVLNLVAIAQSAPGAMAVNASILLGYRIAGLRGALVSIAGTILPPLVILSLISVGYNAFRANRYIAALLNAMRAGVAAVIADVVWTMATNIFKQKKALPLLMMGAAFVAAYFFRVSVLFILPLCALLGALFLREPIPPTGTDPGGKS